MPFPPQGLYCITDAHVLPRRSHLEQARLCVAGGCAVLQLREKDPAVDRDALLEQAGAMADLCRRAGVVFVVNDDVELALRCGADGVHVGQDDLSVHEARRLLGPRAIVGLSTHTRDQVLKSRDLPVDYIGFGPVFPTASKASEYAPRGLDELEWALAHSAVPVTPIGGIYEGNIARLGQRGARHGAVISAAVGVEDVAGAVRRLSALLLGGAEGDGD